MNCDPSGVGCQMGTFAVYPQNDHLYSLIHFQTNSCGQPNMFMQPFKCRVTGATSVTPVAAAQPPRWCEDNPNACVKGAKQMVSWHQASGNNIVVDGWDLSGRQKAPSY